MGPNHNHHPKLLVVGHKATSGQLPTNGLGEIRATNIFCKLLDAMDVSHRSVDLYELFGGERGFDAYAALAYLNHDLASQGVPILEECELEIGRFVEKQLQGVSTICIQSWSFAHAALFATGIHQNRTVIGKVYAHHEEAKFPRSLYEPADFLFAESPLALKVAVDAGIPPWKVLWLPHSPPRFQGRKAEENKIVQIGCISRFIPSKNLPDTLWALSELSTRLSFHFTLWGDGDEVDFLDPYLDLPWFSWKKEPLPHSQLLEEIRGLDLLVHMSGAEAASHVILEALACGVPVCALKASSNPYLYSKGVAYVDALPGFVEEALPYKRPEPQHLLEVLEKVIEDTIFRNALANECQEFVYRDYLQELVPAGRLLVGLGTARGYAAGENLRLLRDKTASYTKHDLALFNPHSIQS